MTDQSINKYSNFDILNVYRFVFIMFIVIFHMYEPFYGAYKGLYLVYVHGGGIGNCFFFLSGFLMVHHYYNRISQGEISFIEYMWRRLKKIYPVYLVSSFIQILYIIRIKAFNAITLQGIILNLSLLTTGWLFDLPPYNNPCWFISVLLLCYCILFFTVKVMKRNVKYTFITLVLWGIILEFCNFRFSFCYRHDGEAFSGFFAGVYYM